MAKIVATIKHPKEASGGNRTEVTRSFIASGLASGRKLKTVVLSIPLPATNVKEAKFKLLVFQPAKAGVKGFVYRWTAHVNVTPDDPAKDTEFTLTATPEKNGGNPSADVDTVELRIPKNSKAVKAAAGPFREPTITYPAQEPHVLAVDEQESFSVYGDTVSPIIGASLGGVEASYVMWVSELGYYCAQFLFLGTNPGPGEYDLVVTNTSGPSVPRPIVIEKP